MAVIYLDIDDEITSAASRIRAAPEGRVALVLPTGSRVATSRINFRLLAREAQVRDRRLSIVAPEASTRALAAAAGLPTFATVGEYEAAVGAEAAGAEAAGAETAGPAGGAPTGAARLDTTALAGAAVVGAAVLNPSAGSAGSEVAASGTVGPTVSVRADPRARGGTDGPVDDPGVAGRTGPVVARPGASPAERPAASRRRGLVLGAVALIVLLAGAAAGAAAYFVLPTASIVLAPRVEPVGPDTFAVRADPAAPAVDATALEIPATRLSLPVEADGTFPATGVKVVETRARGSVVFQNCDTANRHVVRAGTLVRTRSAIGFTTTALVSLPVAVVPGPGQITCPSRTVDVVAVRPGVAGNVAARTITVLPSSLNSNVIFVRNNAPTSGGTRTETTVISQRDVDEARAALSVELADQFQEKATDPAAVPAGQTVYPDTADLGDPVYTEDPAKLVGVERESFDLGASATGEVTAVDTAPIETIATDRIAASVATGYTLVPDSTVVEVGNGEAEGPVVVFAVRATATQVREIDEAAVRAAVRGVSVPEAEQILSEYGEATVTVWPDWVTAVTGLDFRLDLRVVPADTGPVPTPSATPMPPAGATPATSPTTVPGATPASTPRPSPASGLDAATPTP